MVRHVIMWNYKEEFSAAQNAENAARIKQELEALVPVVDGLVSLRVETVTLDSGNMDVLLDSLFESKEALAAYKVHPAHVKAGTFVRASLTNRVCADFETD